MAYSNNYGGNQSYTGQSYGQQTTYGGAQYTSYGAQGGADGGGFLGGSQGGSQGGAGGGKGTYGKDTLRPCTILQILSASQPHPDADFSLDDVEITQISFVGQIRNISQQTTNMTYKLDDGTGAIEVKQWIDSDAPSAGAPALALGDWARVWGRLKAFNNKRHVGAHVLRRVADKNEIHFHLLEATFVHLYFTRGPPEQFSSAAAGGAGAGAGAYGQQQQQGNGYALGNGAEKALPVMSKAAQRIMQCLRNTEQNHEGLHMAQIAAGTGLEIPEVQKGGDELLLHSLIFTTVDDNTWALLEM